MEGRAALGNQEQVRLPGLNTRAEHTPTIPPPVLGFLTTWHLAAQRCSFKKIPSYSFSPKNPSDLKHFWIKLVS